VIKGLVVDENGDPIVGADVRLLAGGTVLNSTTTNSSGRYIFSGLGFGTYSIEVSGRNQTIIHDDLVLSSTNPNVNLITMLGPEEISGPPPKEVTPAWVILLLMKERGKTEKEETENDLADSIMMEDEDSPIEETGD
jgi:protocatechuate 3,4-dioxygenase beta subunit